ncbi:MAG: PPC domain-containing DNA-binding protein [Candidatus Aenigmatarchaeota archaeon]
MNSKKKGNKIFVRIDRGEEVIKNLKEIRDFYDIQNGFFYGIGAVDKVKLGHYDVEKQDYKEKEFTKPFEVTNFTGNIGHDKIHAHITVADGKFNVRGGHCSFARVSGTFEIVIDLTEGIPLNHKRDKETGLDIMDFR